MSELDEQQTWIANAVEEGFRKMSTQCANLEDLRILKEHLETFRALPDVPAVIVMVRNEISRLEKDPVAAAERDLRSQEYDEKLLNECDEDPEGDEEEEGDDIDLDIDLTAEDDV